jgi:two-component system sensor histidine kinase HydH
VTPARAEFARRLKADAPSIGIALLAILLASAVNVVIFRGMHERDRLESSNRCEETMNNLFASLRDHEDFGSAIESSSELSASIVGIGVYESSGSKVYAWGTVPETYSPPAGAMPESDSRARHYIENPKNDSFVFLLHPFRLPPPAPKDLREPRDSRLPPDQRAEARPDAPGPGPADAAPGAVPDGARPDPDQQRSFFYDTLKTAEIVYLEIRQPAYWSANRFRTILFPVVELLIAFLAFFVRNLITRNIEYRRKIEEQRNLVVLGTAASTLAHEIKNPLLSIRLQSSILERLVPEDAKREVGIINAEVDRLSALTYRVNDYLREPKGRPEDFDAATALREISRTMCGRDLVAGGAGGAGGVDGADEAFPVRMDPERFRSIADNILGNAVESGGPAEGLAIELSREDGRLHVDFLDRGPGIPEESRERVFDPFFTTKSRGTGIGLAISRRFAEAAGGSIIIRNREGGGCAVRLTLPAVQGKE